MSRARLQKLFAALLALAVWQGAALLVHAPILLPSPLQVAGRLASLGYSVIKKRADENFAEFERRFLAQLEAL